MSCGLVEETTVELVEQDLRRNVVNKEFMVLYGNDPTKYLPPLPKQERPKSSFAGAWAMNNPAMRQLGNVHRRGPRQHLPGSATQRRPASELISPELRRPQTSHNSRCRSILGVTFDERRPKTTEGKMESLNFRQSRPLRPSSASSTDLIKPRPPNDARVVTRNIAKRYKQNKTSHDKQTVMSESRDRQAKKAESRDGRREATDDASEFEPQEPEPLLNTPAGGLRRPGRYKGSARRAASSRSSASQMPARDKQRVEDLTRLIRSDTDFPPPDRPTAVTLLLAGTKHDFLAERQTLHRDVFPELRDFCESLGYEFQVIDMGIDKSAVPDVAFQLTELAKARSGDPLGPFYLHMQGSYVMKPQPPAEIPAADYDVIYKMTQDLNVEKRELLDVFYRRDDNALPPKYVFQHAAAVVDEGDFRLFVNLWQNLVTIAENAHKISKDKRLRYEVKAANEHEVDSMFHGMKLNPGKALGFHCIAVTRNFTDIATAEQSASLEDYTNAPDDFASMSFDYKPANKIAKLSAVFQKFLIEENIKSYDVPWLGDGIDAATHAQHKLYLSAFADYCRIMLKMKIKQSHDQWTIKHKAGYLYTELLEQTKHFHRTSRSFGGRVDELKTVHGYLKNPDLSKKPLVVSGHRSSGKTSLMCAVAKHANDWIGKSCVCVLRCLGITHTSSDLTQVLVSICIQICNVYNMDSPPDRDYSSINKMAAHFANTLELVAKHHASRKPLLVLLDGLEHLKPIDRSDTLFWLPQTLPRHVYLVVSANSDALIGRLTKRINQSESFVELSDFTSADIDPVIDAILRYNGRKVTEAQKAALLTACQTTPLLVKTLTLEASKWHSWQEPVTLQEEESMKSWLQRLCHQLEDKYGVKFIQKLQAYLCLLDTGASQCELLDLLCCDEDVVKNVCEQYDLSEGQAQQAFGIIQKRLLQCLNDLHGYTVKVNEHGRHLIRYTSDVYRQVLHKKYIGSGNPFTGKNDVLEAVISNMQRLFTSEKPITVKLRARDDGTDDAMCDVLCPTMPYTLSPKNSRKLHVMPQLITLSGSEDEYSKQLKESCLCNYAWLLAKLQCMSGKEIRHDFRQIREKDHEIDTLRYFLQLATPSLTDNARTLALQLLGAMPYLDEDYPLLNQLVLVCQGWIEEQHDTAMLLPMFPFFPSALEFCRAKLWGLVDVMQIDASQRLGVMRNDSGYVEVWDLENNERVHSLGVRYDKVTPNVICSDTHVIGINGADVVLWEIESGITSYCVDLEKLLNEPITSMYLFCATRDFSIAAIHISDDDFNQALAFVRGATGEVLHKLAEFDVKDEFFKSSATFSDDGRRMVFVMARSIVVDDKKSSDFVKLKVFDLETMTTVHTIECGEKKFNRLLLKDNTLAVVSWSDCSFDVYDVIKGQLHAHLSAPDSRLVVEHCALTRDNYLVGLSSSLGDVSRKYFALWFWSLDEQTHANLLTQSFENDSEIPKHFVIIEELHLAVLSSPNNATLSVWDLPNSECIYSTKAHVGSIDNIFKTADPYQVYTCSASEEVVKLWDIYEVIRRAKEDKVHKSRNRARSDVTSLVSSSQATKKSILSREARAAKKQKKEFKKSKSVRFADDESIFSEDFKSTKSEIEIDSASVASAARDVSDMSGVNTLSRDEHVMATQLETMHGATWSHFSQDGSLLILSSDRSLPTMWEMTNGHVIKRLEPHDDHDVATPWAELACDDKIVVGLTLDEHSNDELPTLYKYHVWDLNSGEPMHKGTDLRTNVSVCSVNVERDRIVLCCVEALKPGETSEILFRVLDIRLNECLQEARYATPAVPTQLQLIDDISYAVANHVTTPGEASHGFTVYHLEVLEKASELLEPQPYDFKKGTKHRQYRATHNCIIPGGQLSITTGLNGDLQVWDITSLEYEGNLYTDPSVKDTRNPSLHNHGNKRIHDMVVSDDAAYLVCAGGNAVTSVWDLENEVNIFSYHGHSAEVIKVAMSRDNQLILTAGNDMMLNVWKFSVVDKPLCRLYVHSVITHMHVSSDNKSVSLIGQRKNEDAHFMLFQIKNAPEATEK